MSNECKYKSIVDVFNFTWKEVVCGFWLKYPNKFSKHVLSEDVLERKVLTNGNLRTVRLLAKTNSIPSWGKYIWKNRKNVVYIVEESIVDPCSEKMQVYSYNISYKNIMESCDKLTITSTEGAKDESSVLREGWISSQLKGFRSVIRNFGIQRWKSNGKKATEGFMLTLQEQRDAKNDTSSHQPPAKSAVNDLLKNSPVNFIKSTQ